MSIAQAQGQIDPMQVFAGVQEMIPKFEEELEHLVKQESKRRTEKLRAKIDDDLTEGAWYEAIEEFIADVVDMKAGFIKGPVPRKEPTIEVKLGDNGRYKISVVDRFVDRYERRSPFNIYPQPGSKNIQDGYLIDLISLKPKDLAAMKDVPGFKKEEIDSCLEDYRKGGLREWVTFDSDKLAIEQKPADSTRLAGNIDCLEFWGCVNGEMLLEWGLTEKEIPEPLAEYDICAWKIGTHLIGALLNPDPMKKKPFSKVSYKEKPDCFWGDGLPEVIVDPQRACNAAARSIIHNIGVASGPQVEINKDRLAPGESTKVWPWRTWLTTNDQMETGKAINFYAPPMVVERLIMVYNFFSKIADDHSVPGYAHGDSSVGGAGNALANHEKVLTPKGPVNINSLNIGDLLTNSYGSFSKVTGVYPQGVSDIIRLHFCNGEHIDCDANHRWSVRTHHDRKFVTLTTAEIIEKGLFRKTKKDWRNPRGYRPKWMLPQIDFIEFEERPVKIDPYTMGVLIGNGDARCRVTGMDKEIFEKIPYPLGKVDDKTNSKAVAYTIKGIKSDYLSYGLSGKSTTKFIPEDYLINSRRVRLELLRGLMDTDGCCSKEGEVFFATSSPQLAKDFKKLVLSLGAGAKKICEEEGGEFEINGRVCTRQVSYRIVFNLSDEIIFCVPRKQKRIKQKQKTHIYITGAEYLGKESATCISVDSKDKLFICENSIPTHNTASGLSMLMSQAAKGIKNLIKDIDTKVITSTVKAQFYKTIQKIENMGIIPDFKIVPKGATALLEKEQQAVRRIEFLQMTNNPVDIQLMGPDGRKYLIQTAGQSMDLEVDRLLPDNGKGMMAGALPAQNMPSQPGAETLDQAGNPVVGTGVRQFNSGPNPGINNATPTQ
jgi:hypothetical protein